MPFLHRVFPQLKPCTVFEIFADVFQLHIFFSAYRLELTNFPA